MRRGVQRRHHQGRHLLSDDGEEAPARAGDRAREPAALHLSGRFRRREPAAMAGGVSGSRALRPHLLQSGDAVLARHPADRLRDGLVHGGRRLRAGDVRRGDHRAETRHDLPRRPAAGEGCDRGGGVGGGSRRRGRARAALWRCRSLRGGRRSRARDGAAHRFEFQFDEEGRHRAHAAARSAVRRGRARRRGARATRAASTTFARSSHGWSTARSSTSSNTSTARRWSAASRTSTAFRSASSATTASSIRKARSRPRTSSSCAASGAFRCCSCRTSPASWWGANTRRAASPRTAPRW